MPPRDITLEGHGFSRAENKAARSATWEGARGNPLRVSPAFSLENGWIEIFRAGDYGERGRWTEAQLDQLAADYDPRRHAAPVVLGHPADDAPAYAWVKRLRRAGQSLWAQLEKVDPLLETLLRAGRFAQRSVALYTSFPATGGPYLRHLGFLGAAPPGVKGLAPVRFADVASVTFAFDSDQDILFHRPPATGHRSPISEDAMPESKSKLDTFLDHLRAFFAPDTSPAAVIPSGSEGPAFSERLAALEQRLEALTTATTPAPEKNIAAVEKQQEQIASFIESLRARGRFPPAFEGWGVREFMERLAAADAAEVTDPSAPLRAGKNVCPTIAQEQAVILSEAREGEAKDREQESPRPLLGWFQDFLTKLPAVIEFGELGSDVSHRSPATGHRAAFVRFTEPHRGMSIDPASVELAERAEALAVQLGVSYAEALTRLREERRRTATPV